MKRKYRIWAPWQTSVFDNTQYHSPEAVTDHPVKNTDWLKGYLHIGEASIIMTIDLLWSLNDCLPLMFVLQC